MHIEASHKSAAIAGAWTVFGLVPFEMWMDHHKTPSVLANNVLWLAATAVFFFVPCYLLVLGHGNEPFSRTWFLDPEERARYGVIVKRVLIWFVSAGAVGVVWSAVLSILVSKVAIP
jgi:hypothetical protein